MKLGRVENLVSWTWTGATLTGIGLFFVIFGWLLPMEGARPLNYHGGVADPDAALIMGVLVTITGVVIVLMAVIARLRGPR
jgi:hypothetical protein